MHVCTIEYTNFISSKNRRNNPLVNTKGLISPVLETVIHIAQISVRLWKFGRDCVLRSFLAGNLSIRNLRTFTYVN